MISQNFSSILRKFPSLHAAAKSFYTNRLISKIPKRHPKGFFFIGLDSMQSGNFEPEETEQIEFLLQQPRVLVNVGANYGYYVCLARNTGRRVIAIEPLERNVYILKNNMEINAWDDIEILPVALGKEVGLKRIYGGGTAASMIEGWAGARRDSHETVPVTTLDNILSDRLSNEAMLILIDVEGVELEVLQGSTRQLCRRTAPIWIVEININEHQPGGRLVNPNLLETFELFWQHGYTAEKAGCETGRVNREDITQWVKGNCLPLTHNFLFHREPESPLSEFLKSR